MKYEPVIGLEVHVQLGTKSKLFCACPTDFGSEPNANTCPVCLGMPGTLPVLNQKALELGMKAGLALDCEINERLKFDRKNYFYPDLPKAYQISQFDMPVNKNGYLWIEIKGADGKLIEKRVGITRAHLEEDAGKLLHEGILDGTLVDYNRGGIPLLEIVSEPDIRSADEAYAYLTALKAVLQYAGVSDCDMDMGKLRCDANVSVRPVGQEKFGTRTETKNLNSFRAVQKAIEYEIARQTQLIEDGGVVEQQTRLWNEAKGETALMRSKEDAHDYRYFPEPDLVPFTIARDRVETMRKTLPELPRARAKRFVENLGLPRYDALVLVQDQVLAAFFENVIKEGASAKLASNWLLNDLLGILNEKKIAIENSPITPKALAGLILLIDNSTINGKIAKDVLLAMLEENKSADQIVKEKGLAQVQDTGLIEQVADKVIAANPKSVEDFKAGKKQALGFLVGQIMKESQGKANPKLVNEILTKKLS